MDCSSSQPTPLLQIFIFSIQGPFTQESTPFFKDVRPNFGALSLYNAASAGHWVFSAGFEL
jgi:hypothetical protein